MSNPIKILINKGFTETEAIEFLRGQAIDWFFMAKNQSIKNPNSEDFNKIWEDQIHIYETIPDLDVEKMQDYIAQFRK